jgi:hypothetical protein
MAYRGDPSSPAGKARMPSATSPLTSEDFEQLAAAFRPSWELDEAPFTGPGALSPGDLRALQGGGTRADVRATVQLTNGTHAPPKATVSHEPENSVVIDRSITASDIPAPRITPSNRPPAPSFQLQARAAPFGAALPAAPQVPNLPLGPAVGAIPAAPIGSSGFEVEEPSFVRPSKKPLWLGIGAGAVVLIAAGVWLASGSSGGEDRPATIPASTAERPRAHTFAPMLPPPPETTAAGAVPPPQAPPATLPPVVPAAVTPAAVVATTAPPPAPPPTRVTPAAAPPPRPVAAPASKPAPRRTAGPTIVRDVPF